VAEVSDTLALPERLVELEAIIERGLATFMDVGNALLEIRKDQLYLQTHGTFENYCKERWGWTRQRAYQLMDAADVSRILDTPPANAGQAAELVPLKDDEVAVVEAWRDAREQAEALGTKLSAAIVKNAVEKRLGRIRREKAVEEAPSVSGLRTANMRIENCDFRKLDIPDESISLVFTDPPYPTEFLDLWYELGAFAAAKLAPGGVLVAYSGQFHLPEVIQALCSHLEYTWLGALVTPGAHNNVMQRRVRSVAKPLLFFHKPPLNAETWFSDAYISESREKELHDWQQSPGCAEYYIETLTNTDGLVCDPFLGSGTTAWVANKLGREFVGCDVDPAAVLTAIERVRS
jgi:16S rRNA G966 N2-methylase RsmD